MNTSLQQMVLRATRTSGLFRWMRRRHRRELLVLTYHSVVAGVDEPRQRYPLVYRNAVTAEHFEQQMHYLRRHYQVLDGETLRAVLDGAPLPDQPVVITFDDGLLNNATVAFPILQRLQIPAFFFLPTGFVDAASEGQLRCHWTENLIARLSLRADENAFDASAVADRLPALRTDLAALAPSQAILRVVDHMKALPQSKRSDRLDALDDVLGEPLSPSLFPADPQGNSILATMTWDHVRTAAADGITPGGHTVNHEILARLPDEPAATEIETSLHAIAENIHQPADWFAYPNGQPQDFTSFHRAVLSETGCRGAFTQIAGFNDTSTDPLTLRRIDVSPDYDLSTFCYVASGTKHWVDRVVRRRPHSSL